MQMRPIRVVAPATSANLGPGFDCLGLALDLWNQLDVLPASTHVSKSPLVEITGEGAGELPGSSQNLVYRSMAFLFREAGLQMPAVQLHCHNQIPLKRGLGSSAAAIAGGLVAANGLCSSPFSANALLEMAATIEGHPDNVAAAVLGGLQLVVAEPEDSRIPSQSIEDVSPSDTGSRGHSLAVVNEGSPHSPSSESMQSSPATKAAHEGVRLFTASINVPLDLHVVLFIPDVRIATSDARAVLPEKVSRADAVYNMSRAALLVTGMATNRPEYLGVATQDRIHQPYRRTLFPAMKVIFDAARKVGALGVFLSGSGSTILALTRGREMTVAYEMAEAGRQAGVSGQLKITQPTPLGAHVVDENVHR